MNDIAIETNLKKKSKFKKLLLCATATLIALFLSITLLCFPNFSRNLFFAAFEAYYFIPNQGSIFTFQPTTFNSGSEVFWL
ncbi:hypothetical protein LJB86_05160, partial [Deltaproteobacteria bacterium OttesenSCG-928-M10]|nr:hypothetical protein [Deltaproteobacteria bacterium OttesenSCG-928-M10]